MAPHSIALRTLGIASIVYAGVLLAEPVMSLRAVLALAPVLESIVQADPDAQKQLAASGMTPQQAASQARWRMMGGAWEAVAPAVVLAAVGLLGGVLLALGHRAGPWIVLVFALWPAAAWAAGRIQDAWTGAAVPVARELARRTIRFELLGRAVQVDARAYGTAVRLVFMAVTLATLGWAFMAGRRAAGQDPAAPAGSGAAG